MSAEVGGLTEAERESLGNTIRDVIGRSYGFDAICRSVERIVADRERAAEMRGSERAWDEGHRLARPHSDACEPTCPNPYRADRSAP